MSKPNIWIHLLLILTLSTALSGCALYSANGKFYSAPNRGAYIGAASGAIIGAATGVGFITPITTIMGGMLGGALLEVMQQRKPLIEKLRIYDVYVVYWGNEVKIMVPSDVFFYSESPNPSPVFYHAMDLIAALLRGIDKISIKVAGYTDAAGSPIRDKVLSTQQAQTIATYLWGQCIDARLIYAVGCGQENPIANNITAKGRCQNRRIEITLRKITTFCKDR